MITVKSNRFICSITLCIVIIIIIVAFIIIEHFLKYKEYQVKLLEYKSIEYNTNFSNDKIPYVWWDVLHYADETPNPLNSPTFSLDEIDFSEIDFNRYNVVISQGRKINKLIHVKEQKFPYLPMDKGTSRAYFDKNYYNNKIFIYLINKNEQIIFDLKCNPESLSIVEN